MPDKPENIQKIYKTTYKKGYMTGEFHFGHIGTLDSAIQHVKAFLSKRHLKHLHTVPFLIDLDNESDVQTTFGGDCGFAASGD